MPAQDVALISAWKASQRDLQGIPNPRSLRQTKLSNPPGLVKTGRVPLSDYLPLEMKPR